MTGNSANTHVATITAINREAMAMMTPAGNALSGSCYLPRHDPRNEGNKTNQTKIVYQKDDLKYSCNGEGWLLVLVGAVIRHGATN